MHRCAKACKKEGPGVCAAFTWCWVSGAGCCWLLCCWLLLASAASGCFWLLLAAAGCCWLLLAAGRCWLLLLLGAVGCCWVLLGGI